MTDNKSAFAVNQYDENVRKVIPHYDEIYEQIFSVITTYCGDKPLAVLDTGCGTGNFGVMALNRLNLTELVLCDPSEKMLAETKKKLANQGFEFHCIGSEKLDFSNRFDIVTDPVAPLFRPHNKRSGGQKLLQRLEARRYLYLL